MIRVRASRTNVPLGGVASVHCRWRYPAYGATGRCAVVWPFVPVATPNIPGTGAAVRSIRAVVHRLDFHRQEALASV